MPSTSFQTKSFIKLFAPAIAWGIFITTLSVMPGDEVPDLIKSINDKLIHTGMYFFLSFLIILGFSRYKLNNSTTRATQWLIMIILTLYGGILELVQYYLVLNRNGDWQDFLANGAGSAAGVLFFYLLTSRKKA